MFRNLPSYDIADASLIALGEAMIQDLEDGELDKALGEPDDDENVAQLDGRLRLPAGYTYFGAFVGVHSRGEVDCSVSSVGVSRDALSDESVGLKARHGPALARSNEEKRMGMDGARGEVLPMYFVGDESYSMEGEPMSALNLALTHLRDGSAKSPSVGEKVRFGIVTFAGDAMCRLELSELSDEMSLPTLACREGGTVYGKVFEDLRNRLPGDVQTLKSQGFKVRRPSVFFLSDGNPTDGTDWQEPLRRLKDQGFRERPNILSFGIGEADADVIREVATQPKYAWMAEDPSATARAISEFGQALLESMSKSAEALARGDDTLQIPEPEGFVSLKSDVI